MASATTVKNLTAALPILNTTSPFQEGNRISAFAVGTPTIYGVNSPARSNTAKFFQAKQSISGNKAFALGSLINTPQNTTGGALSDANQLRVVGILAGVIKKRARGDQVAPASGFVVGAGGGTAAGDATYVVDGVQAAGATSIQVKSSGANTKTVLVGDKINIAGDSTDYFMTATTQTFNGTTAVALAITPPLQAATGAASAVTITAADGKTVIFADAAAVGATVEVWVMDSGDVTTVATLAASVHSEVVVYDAMVASAATDLFPLAKA